MNTPSIRCTWCFLWILWIFHKRYKQSPSAAPPHSPVTWSPPLDFCFRTSWGSYRTCPVGQLGPGYGPVSCTLWHSGIARNSTRKTWMLLDWHCRFYGLSLRRHAQSWSQMFAKQNMFNDSWILKWQERHPILGSPIGGIRWQTMRFGVLNLWGNHAVYTFEGYGIYNEVFTPMFGTTPRHLLDYPPLKLIDNGKPAM